MAQFPELDALRSEDELESRQAELESQITRMVSDKAGLPLTDEERDQLASWKAERDEAQSRAKELRELRAMVDGFSRNDRNVERPSSFNIPPSSTRTENIYDLSTIRHGFEAPERAATEYRDRALKAIETTRFATPNGESNEDVQDRVADLLDKVDSGDAPGELARRILTTNTPAYKRAFGKYVAGVHRTPEEERALSLTTTAGGFAVPVTLDPSVILTSNGVINPVRGIANVIQITGNTWNGVSSAGVSAAYSAEETEASDNAPTLAQPAANVEKAQAFIPFSIEIGQDWGALQSEMSRLLADAKDTLESDKFLKGLGHSSNQPEGLLVGATGTVVTATASVIVTADLYSLIQAVPPRFRARAVFAGNLATYHKIRQLDTSGGADLWVQLQFGEPGNLVGRPAHEWSDYSSAITTGGSSVLTFGDFNQFMIVDRVGMNVEVVPHLFATANNRPSGQRGLYAYWRNTSDVTVAGAFKTLKIKA